MRISPPRISIEITKEQELIYKRIPHGLRVWVFRKLLEDLGALMDKSPRAIQLYIAGAVSLEDFIGGSSGDKNKQVHRGKSGRNPDKTS
jgi:hypothetical protein